MGYFKFFLSLFIPIAIVAFGYYLYINTQLTPILIIFGVFALISLHIPYNAYIDMDLEYKRYMKKLDKEAKFRTQFGKYRKGDFGVIKDYNTNREYKPYGRSSSEMDRAFDN